MGRDAEDALAAELESRKAARDTSYEANLKDDEPRVVNGNKGMSSKSFSKRFKNQSDMERWLDSPEAGDVTVREIKRA